MQVTGFGNKDWLQAVFSDHGGKTGLYPWEWSVWSFDCTSAHLSTFSILLHFSEKAMECLANKAGYTENYVSLSCNLSCLPLYKESTGTTTINVSLMDDCVSFVWFMWQTGRKLSAVCSKLSWCLDLSHPSAVHAMSLWVTPCQASQYFPLNADWICKRPLNNGYPEFKTLILYPLIHVSSGLLLTGLQIQQ